MIAIVDYGAGNLLSVSNAIKRAGYEPLITADPAQLKAADKVIFPGVGAAGAALRQLSKLGLADLIPSLQQPVLGICLGLQLLCRYTEEDDTAGLGVFPLDVCRFPSRERVPHMGWNQLSTMEGLLFKGLEPNPDLYFVHSYYAPMGPCTVAQCHYQLPFSAALQYKNFFATQFHPEKSAGTGALILSNFLSIET